MSVSMISCPSCQNMVLSDTIQCPECGHVLDPDRAANAPELSPGNTQADDEPREDPCANCGEMVRRGLVRCWNCGQFMKKEIAESYRQMQEGEQPITYSELPPGAAEGAPTPASESEQMQAEKDNETADQGANEPEELSEEDFELAPDIPMFAESIEEVEPAGAEQTSARDASETYQLSNQESESPSDDQTAVVEGKESQDDSQSSKQPEGEQSEDEGPAEAHSVATGGDVLLNVALEQEAEREKQRGRPKRPRMPSRPGMLWIFCPYGHRIEVHERHRGKTGRCPRCRARFIVPEEVWKEGDEKAQGAAEEEAEAAEATKRTDEAAGEFARWMTDVHMHVVDPSKLKLKPGSLLREYDLYDLGFSTNHLLAAELSRKTGLFGSVDPKKAAQKREALRSHLRDGLALDAVPVDRHRMLEANEVQNLRIAQPIVFEYESMFAGVPVFGEGRIAVMFPKRKGSQELHFVSFTLSEFRREFEIPMTDEQEKLKCHYSDEVLQVIEKPEFYQADPGFKLKLVGWRCDGCGLVVSEDSRKKEKIGGVAGRGIAKALCPKCKRKFGENPLYGIEEGPPPEQQLSAKDDKASEQQKPAAAE